MGKIGILKKLHDRKSINRFLFFQFLEKAITLRSLALVVLIIFIILPIYFCMADNNEEYTMLEYRYNDYIIMPETLVYKIKQNADDYILYDVRQPEAYSKSHIIGAKSLPWGGVEKNFNIYDFPKDKQIILISSDGFYSLKALELLLNNGFTSVYSIEGGMDNWPYKKLLVK